MRSSLETDGERDVALASELRDPEQILAVVLDPKRRGSLYPYLHRLCALAPILRTEQVAGKPTWVLTSYADIREVIEELIDRVEPNGRMDVVHDFAFLLPVIVICEMLASPPRTCRGSTTGRITRVAEARSARSTTRSSAAVRRRPSPTWPTSWS